MIRTYGDKATAAIANRLYVKGLQEDMQSRAASKLDQINAAERIDDLRIPPSNRLEKLEGANKWSIRVNRQWRITFDWRGGNAFAVLIEDYH